MRIGCLVVFLVIHGMAIDQALPTKVLATYKKCLESGEVKYYPSEVIQEKNELKVIGELSMSR